MTTETRTPATREEREAVERALNDAFADDRRRFAGNVIARLKAAPRYQSIGRKTYVYVEDVAQALEREMYR